MAKWEVTYNDERIDLLEAGSEEEAHQKVDKRLRFYFSGKTVEYKDNEGKTKTIFEEGGDCKDEDEEDEFMAEIWSNIRIYDQ
jgi:hypothetical protein